MVSEAPNLAWGCLNKSIFIRRNQFSFSLGPHLHGFFGLFLKYATFVHNSPPVTLLFFLPPDLVHNLESKQSVEGFCKQNFFSILFRRERWYNIKGKCRRYFSHGWRYFLFQNRILRKKLCDFKKKIIPIGATVQKLFIVIDFIRVSMEKRVFQRFFRRSNVNYFGYQRM